MHTFFGDIANTVGLIGVFIILYAYMMLQIGRMRHEGIMYSLLNLVGSILILYSLFFYWNLASGVIEVAWLVISIYGLIKAIRLRKNGVVENIH